LIVCYARRMKAQYDPEADALYLELGTQTPDGVVEVAAGFNVDTTGTGEIVGIEILDASSKINIALVFAVFAA